jgi:hypothetical protein
VGKKSRLKRERRAAKAVISFTPPKDQGFRDTCVAIRSLMARYRADDVFGSLCVSDLWLPNISSQVKHALAWVVALSLPASAFTGVTTIKSYLDFKCFIEWIYATLPSFPELEDYVPETDWGEVRYLSKGVPLRIFYGGAVERISDFITSFHLVHGTKAQALEDMHLALLVQDQLLAGVAKSAAGVADDVETGHVETPSEEFWCQCRKTILALSKRPDFAGASPRLVLKLGAVPLPDRMFDFADAIMTGSALPGFLVEIGDRRYPLALRNASAAVVQHWAEQSSACSPAAIADFISARMRHVIKGPLQVVTRTGRSPFLYSAAILAAAKPYLVIALQETELAQLPEIEADLKRALRTGDWALRRVGEHGATQIRGKGGLPGTIEQLVILAVLFRVTTVPGFLKLPKTKARFLPLADFVTIFDSIEDIDELDQYWAFIDSNAGAIGAFSGPADRFAAFRDSHALLADGAVVPTMIALDPHWGSTWRHRMLTKYWDNAPPLFPDAPDTAWNVERDSDGIFTLEARRLPAMSRSTVIGTCVAHFVLVIDDQAFELNDGRILDLLLQCLADALNQRMTLVADLPLFAHRQIVTICQANMNTLVSQDDQDHSDEPLFSGWHVTDGASADSIQVVVRANLQHVQARLANATDASFEVAAALAWIEGLSSVMGVFIGEAVLDAVRDTSTRRARFTTMLHTRTIDVPDHANPQVPGPEHYKLARRDLAIAFKDMGAEEGNYELAEAKALIDPARDRFRAIVHDRIAALSRPELVRFCIQQIDELATKYDRKYTQIEMSLTHEISYDRAVALAEANDHFVKDSRNYRYLLECCVSLPISGSDPVIDEAVVKLIASIDWLMVLYDASNVLHNGIDVAGLELDHFFVPRVFYASMSGSNESAFAQEAADFKLGVGLNPADEVRAIREDDPKWDRLNQAFHQDTGVSLRKFLGGLLVLRRWPSAIESPDLRFGYSAPRDKVCDVLVDTVVDMTSVDADKVVALLILDPSRIRRLLGKSTVEGDVPLWEHNKRGDRYMIKPLIQDEGGNLAWGAATVERSARIWRQTLVNGYMPADFDWPNVKSVVRDIKQDLDKKLETTTATVLARATPHVKEGIDFKYRFPTERFDDVGDFDGLAYWPATNFWVSVECKYNQPAFCLKDARRLRDRIFGTPESREQFAKIERRRTFLHDNLERIRLALGWPAPTAGLPARVHELYVSRDIYWWMRNPPYPVPTQFVRVDGLDSWLRSNGLLT